MPAAQPRRRGVRHAQPTTALQHSSLRIVVNPESANKAEIEEVMRQIEQAMLEDGWKKAIDVHGQVIMIRDDAPLPEGAHWCT